jgi:hydrogenase nickel incorporation protein HypA/HybF
MCAMHEWALAEAVVESAVAEADRAGLRLLTAIRLQIGELQQIDREAFEFAIVVLAQERPEFGEVSISIETEAAEMRCRACGHTWLLDESLATLEFDAREAIHFLPEVVHAFVRCPRCNSPDFDVLRGRGIALTAVSGTDGAA